MTGRGASRQGLLRLYHWWFLYFGNAHVSAIISCHMVCATRAQEAPVATSGLCHFWAVIAKKESESEDRLM